MQEHAGALISSSSSSLPSSASSKNNSVQPSRVVNRQISRSPMSNEMSGITSAFVSLLEVADVRYGLECYGPFLRHIPQRLGTNEALDASVSAMTAAFSTVHAHDTSAEALSKYVHALRTLRISLSDPAKRQTSDTLCAIYLIVICQVSETLFFFF